MTTFLVGEKVQTLSATNLTSGSVNDTEILFKFKHADEWRDLTKIAIFSNNKQAVRVGLIDDKCFVPAEILETEGDITIGVYGYEMGDNEEVALRKSPTPLEISVWSGSYNKDATDPTPEQVDICEQALATAQTANATAQSVRDDADAGVFDGTSVSNATINENGRLIMSLDNGESIDAGNVLPALQNKTITPSEIPQTAVADDGYYALGSVSVEPIQTENLTATQNGDYTAPSGKYFKKVTVDTQINEVFSCADGRTYATEVTIPDTVTTLGGIMYKDAVNMRKVNLPSTLLTITDNVFQGSGLESVTIPSSVLTLTQSCFKGCKSLTTVEFEERDVELYLDSAAFVGNGVFVGCTNLRELHLPSLTPDSNIREICHDCSNLTSVTFPQTFTGTIGTSAFDGCNFSTIDLPNGITSIGRCAFQNNKSLSNITIPSNVVTIGNNAFTGCTNLEIVTIQHGTQTLGDGCFYNCFLLETIYLPNTLQNSNSLIGNNYQYFLGACSRLKNVILENNFITSIKLTCSTLYTADDIVEMFNALGTVPSGETRSFILGATNLNKLTAAQKAIATDKGWTLA